MSERRLGAYHDGELGPLARWRVRRELARSERARAELAALGELGRRVRDAAPPAPDPDLWAAIHARLPQATGPLAEELRPGRRSWLPLAVPALAAAAAIAVLVLGGQEPDPAPAGSVRWLHARGRPAMVLQDDREATIIWVLDGPDRTSRRGSHGVG